VKPADAFGERPTVWTRSRTDREVLALHLAVVGDCWEWTGVRQRNGYGRCRRGDRDVLVHRLAYQVAVGPIPEGLQVDHLCRNRACIRPDHLEAVSLKVNCHRSDSVGGINARKTRCPKGHPYDAENTWLGQADVYDKQVIDRVIYAMAGQGHPFSVNDFRELLPEVRNCLISHRLRAAVNAGVLVKVGKTPSTLKSTHAHEINVYRGTK